jgi:hypothetical protein
MGNPKKPQESTSKTGPKDQGFMFFNISAEVTYQDQEAPDGEAPNLKREKVAILFRGSSRGITGRELARIHARIILEFQSEYAKEIGKFTKVTPEAKKVVFLTFVPLGVFTDAEFSEGIEIHDTPVTPPAEPEKKA